MKKTELPLSGHNKPAGISRRSFVVGAASLAAGASVSCLPDVDGQWSDEGKALCSWTEPTITPGEPSHTGQVVEVFDPALTPDNVINPVAIAENLKKLLLALTGRVDVAGAWTALIPDLSSEQIVGIKVNTLNSQVPTQPEVVKALVDSLKLGTGLGPERILVWDRRMDELIKCGFTPDFLGASVEGTWTDAKIKGEGRGYEVDSICLGGRKTKLSNILTRRIDHLINIAVVKRHDASGFTGCMKNHYGSIDNPGEFHDDIAEGGTVIERRFEKAIPALNALDEVVGKTRLWMLDGTFCVCKGGTESPVDCLPNRLTLGLDPVAIDARARQIRDEERGALGPDPETISEGWMTAAERVGLGTGTPKVTQI